MPKTKQRRKIQGKRPEPEHKNPARGPDTVTALDLDHEIEQGLRAIAARAREGDSQALKLLLAYREERMGDAGPAYFSDLTEIERRALKSALIGEIISLREETASLRRDCG